MKRLHVEDLPHHTNRAARAAAPLDQMPRGSAKRRHVQKHRLLEDQYSPSCPALSQRDETASQTAWLPSKREKTVK